jgi:hypothetical protein
MLRTGAALALAGFVGLAGSGLRSVDAGAMHRAVAPAATYHSVERTSLSKVALSLQDVTGAFGSGFVKQPGVGLGNDVFGKKLTMKVGRVSGYETGYIRQHPGPIMLNSGVDLFRNKSFAVAAVQRVYTVYSNPQNQKSGVRVARLHGLGDAAFILTYDLGVQKGAHFRELTVMFSRGAYAADIVLVAGGSIDRGKLLSLANTMDTRIKHA